LEQPLSKDPRLTAQAARSNPLAVVGTSGVACIVNQLEFHPDREAEPFVPTRRYSDASTDSSTSAGSYHFSAATDKDKNTDKDKAIGSEPGESGVGCISFSASVGIAGRFAEGRLPPKATWGDLGMRLRAVAAEIPGDDDDDPEAYQYVHLVLPCGRSISPLDAHETIEVF